MTYKTRVASLDSYEKGSIKVNDDLRHYAFSNIFEVAAKAKPFERVMVASNLEYAAEVIKADGESPWYRAPHDEFAIVMDGEIEFTFHKLTDDETCSHQAGAALLDNVPQGPRMGRVVARRGHEVLLPEGSTYRLSASTPSVAIIQTLAGPLSIERWSEICTLN